MSTLDEDLFWLTNLGNPMINSRNGVHPQVAGSPVRPVLWSKHWDDEEDEAAICRYRGRDYNRSRKPRSARGGHEQACKHGPYPRGQRGRLPAVAPAARAVASQEPMTTYGG